VETKAIWKYELPLESCGQPQEVEIPDGATILSAMNQDEKLVVYAMVAPARKPRKYQFKVFMTGQAIPFTVNHHFVGTVAFQGGDFVVHVFETNRW